LVTLLQSDDEAVMKALTRLGSQLREMQSKEQKLKKRNGRKRKPKTKQEAVENNDSSTSDAADEEVKHLNIQMEHTRKVVQELTELADALLFGGETDAYELTKADWIHRFQLEQYPSSLARQRPTDISDERPETKKQRRGYFDDATNNNNDENGESSNQSEPMLAPHDDYNEVMWEYKGNEDGAIHGPYTSRQMMEWTSCGYFVGESAVDIRRVGSLSSELGKSEKKAEATTTSRTDVDDLMADLDSDGEDDDEAETVNAESSWMKSDRVDFSLYL
jgi:CD2 antigen cytoplasmic tail-binding protein 2